MNIIENKYFFIGDWGLGIGDWGLGVGGWGGGGGGAGGRGGAVLSHLYRKE